MGEGEAECLAVNAQRWSLLSNAKALSIDGGLAEWREAHRETDPRSILSAVLAELPLGPRGTDLVAEPSSRMALSPEDLLFFVVVAEFSDRRAVPCGLDSSV